MKKILLSCILLCSIFFSLWAHALSEAESAAKNKIDSIFSDIEERFEDLSVEDQIEKYEAIRENIILYRILYRDADSTVIYIFDYIDEKTTYAINNLRNRDDIICGILNCNRTDPIDPDPIVVNTTLQISQLQLNNREFILEDGIETVLYKWILTRSSAKKLLLQELVLETWSRNTVKDLRDVIASAYINIEGKVHSGIVGRNSIEFNDDISINSIQSDVLITAVLKESDSIEDNSVLQFKVEELDAEIWSVGVATIIQSSFQDSTLTTLRREIVTVPANVQLTQARVNDREFILEDEVETVLYKWSLTKSSNEKMLLQELILETWSKNTVSDLRDVIASAYMNIEGKVYPGIIEKNSIEFNSDVFITNQESDILVTASLKYNDSTESGSVLQFRADNIEAQIWTRDITAIIQSSAYGANRNVLLIKKTNIFSDIGNVDVVSLGAYEWSYKQWEWHGWGFGSRDSSVHHRDTWYINVDIEEKVGEENIFLVLSSYEPVDWKINDPKGLVRWIIVSWYHKWTISWIDSSIPVGSLYHEVDQSSSYFYAYKKDSSWFKTMEKVVEKYLEQSWNSFEWAYSANTFTLSSNSIEVE